MPRKLADHDLRHLAMLHRQLAEVHTKIADVYDGTWSPPPRAPEPPRTEVGELEVARAKRILRRHGIPVDHKERK